MIIFIIYFGSDETILTFAIMGLSIISLSIWINIIASSYRTPIKYNITEFTIKNADDPSSAIIGYFLTYTISLPSVAVIGGLRGLVVLFALLVIIYFVLYENRIAFFNPLLSLLGYKMYHFETTENASGYIIIKVGGIDYKPSGKMMAAQIDDFMYICRISKKKPGSS